MEQMTKKIDDKLLTISKMQANLRSKRIDYAAFLTGNHLDLPPINNVLVSFPPQEKVDIKNTPKPKKIVELERLLETHSNKINSEELNRIIFANPNKSRMTFQRTFFRSSIYYTIDQRKGRQANKLSKSMDESGQQINQFRFTPIKIKQQNQKIQQIKINLLSEPNPKINTPKPQQLLSNVLDSNPESIIQKRKKERSAFRKGNTFKLPSVSLNVRSQRYSPWKNDELEEQLIL